MKSSIFLLAVALWGCEQEGGPPAAGAPVPISEYCEAIHGGVCEWQARCGCELDEACPVAVERCETALAEVIGFVASGRTQYDGAAARILADHIAVASCDEDPAAVFGYHFIADFLDFNGVFVGTLPPGSDCTFANQESDDVGDHIGSSVECVRGTCKDGVCLELRDVGEACDETVRCFDFELPYGPWDPDAVPRQACDGTCQPLLADGEACSIHYECASRLCDSASGTSVCTVRPDDSPHLPIGAACESRRDCDSGACDRGVCAVRACSI